MPQTYNGILTHCGEKTFLEYRPAPCPDFDALNELIESCYIDQSNIRDLRPSTLEGCVVRISDIIAYLGKDRQDAARIKLLDTSDYDESPLVGKLNHQIIQNITRNIIKNSLGHDYLAMDEEVFARNRRDAQGKLREDLQERRSLRAHHLRPADDGAHVHDLRRRYPHGA